MQAAVRCPADAFAYNSTRCACNPGYLYNSSTNSCSLFSERSPNVELSSGVDYESSLAFPETIFSFDSIKKLTQSQAVFLEATLAMLLAWLGFCLLLRFSSLGSDGRSPWFRIRWWISRLDISFATHHWLDDQKPVIKRKTELGGTFSIASWILFIGLLAALLYQIISKRSVEVHTVKATNAPDLISFSNDFEFNITTVSSMSCAQLSGLGTLVTGNPFFGDQRTVPLSTFFNYSCLNTTAGPTITFKCSQCRPVRDFTYVSWQFVDHLNSPATAVGFRFNLTVRNHGDKKHLSFVSGTLKNATDYDGTPVTYRGAQPNILKFNLFPRVYHNHHKLKLIQPLFHEFLRGSYFSDRGQLQASLESSRNGLINTTLYFNFLSSYIIEIDNQNILGPVSFLADLGGLYCISIGIFFFFLVQCEYRVKKLRHEDSVMKMIRNRRKAQDRWNKLRKYVRYTWGPCSLGDDTTESTDVCCNGIMSKSLHKDGSLHRRRMRQTLDTISFDKNVALPDEKKSVPEDVCSRVIQPFSTEAPAIPERSSSYTKSKPGNSASHVNEEHKGCEGSHRSSCATVCRNHGCPLPNIANLPPLPSCEFSSGNIGISDLEQNVRKLYEYNALLREQLVAVSSSLSKDEEKEEEEEHLQR
ncbi:uncharacterized protein LOC127241294 [Andrographis paniculata]|uniref:uncharacterized protein LOC127241294 n=1 Tax=Andrographis paniculata TaxID=175694 RepID=UPI0021E75FA7|nr:uncharacterized protein LOC127241294 [Andrographis paniculata]